MLQNLGAMMNLLANKGKLQEEMLKFQEAVGRITATGEAGGGLVTVTANGKLEVTAVKLGGDLGDRELVEDLVVAACNQALGRVREQIAAESGKVATAIGIPPGMLGGMPGFGG